MKKGELSSRQRRFVTAMLTSRTIEQAANVVGVTERTAHRYLNLPAVKQALASALDETMSQAARQTVAAMTGALETLKEVHSDSSLSPGARVAAARTIIEAGPKLREALDLVERVARLEQLIEGGK